MEKYLLAHDLGTSGNKATLFSEKGVLASSTFCPYDTHYFHNTWVEQNAEDWWNAVCATTRRLIEQGNIQPRQIAAVSFSGQMLGCLCVDRSGNPLRPSIIWADQRAVAQAEALEESISQWDFYHLTGHRNTASYGMQKLMWVKENEPDIYEQTYKTLNAKDYIVFKLTGHFYTDYSDGNSNGCYDILHWKWSEELISYAGLDPDKFPELKPSTFTAGHVTPAAAKETGLCEGTPVILGGGDGVAASVGAGSVSPGKTYCCLGTSAWIASTSEAPVFDDKMRTVTWAHMVPGLYVPNGTMQYAAGAYNWIKNTICQPKSLEAARSGGSPYDYMNREIEQSVPGSNGILFLPYLLGERAPRWNPDAKGAFIGLKPENTKNDLLRSVLEGVTLNLSLILDILKTHISIDGLLVLGGGAKGAVWRQIMADIFGTRIYVPELLDEAGSMGAAITAGVGCGLFRDFSAAETFIHIRKSHSPCAENQSAYQHVKELFDDIYHALEPVYKKM